MSAFRPSPQAKYELLLENKSTSSNVKQTIAATVIFVAIIGITSITVYLSWSSLKAAGNGSFLESMDISKNTTAMAQTFRVRLELYGTALKQMQEVNKSTAEWMVTPNTSVAVGSEREGSPEATKLVCYYSLPVGDDLTPQAIDPALCTHINIAVISVVNKTLQPITVEQSKVFKEVVALKVVSPSLKVLMCIGGYSGPGGFSEMVSTHESRKRFIKQVLSTVKEYSLDGVDLDWEFPAWNSDRAEEERVHFTQLLRELRAALDRPLLLSVAVAAPQPIIDQAYDVPEMARYVDYINLMAYDYHFYIRYLPITGANAPLYSRADEQGYFSTLNTNWSTFYWLEKGMPKSKIVVGLPTYGHSFKLMNADNHGWSAPASGFGSLGSGGFVRYRDVCQFITLGGAKFVFDRDSHVPYAYQGIEWVSYDDIRSVSYKAEYVVNNSYAGVMVFSLNQDDYEGQCSGNPFLLTRQVKNVLQDDLL